MSKVPFWVEAVCSECSATTAGRFCTQIPQREMAAQLKKAGWVISGSDTFCSHHCQSLYTERLSNEHASSSP